MSSVIDWLLCGSDWIRFRTMQDLLEISVQDSQVVFAREGMLQDQQILQLIEDAGKWHESLLKRHNDANHPIHKLSFLAELGCTFQNPHLGPVIKSVINNLSSEGFYQVLSHYPVHFGGTGQDEWLWALCDTPLIAYFLLKMQAVTIDEISLRYQYLFDKVTDKGWQCTVSPAIPRFRGPGRKDDGCPYATLLMLKLLSQLDHDKFAGAIFQGVQALLQLWEDSSSRHPFLFKMGTDFRKLKVPFIWYDLLHTADVLSHFSCALQDERFKEILELIMSKADSSGRYNSESIWTKWRGWEFCQKNEPSRWLTFCVLRILKRAKMFSPSEPHAGVPAWSGHLKPAPNP